jgi:hypothetical protein
MAFILRRNKAPHHQLWFQDLFTLMPGPGPQPQDRAQGQFNLKRHLCGSVRNRVLTKGGCHGIKRERGSSEKGEARVLPDKGSHGQGKEPSPFCPSSHPRAGILQLLGLGAWPCMAEEGRLRFLIRRAKEQGAAVGAATVQGADSIGAMLPSRLSATNQQREPWSTRSMLCHLVPSGDATGLGPEKIPRSSSASSQKLGFHHTSGGVDCVGWDGVGWGEDSINSSGHGLILT